MVKSTKLARLDKEFEKDMREAARMRLVRGLAKANPKEISIAEMTRLLRRTPSYQLSLEDLKTKPKRENLFR